MIYFGGGGIGDRDPNSTQFNDGLKNVVDYGKGHSSKPEYFYNSKFPETSLFAKQQLGQEAKSFTTSSYAFRIEQLIQQIEKGEVKEPVLILIDTHGKLEKNKFQISTQDGAVEPVEQLKRLSEMAKAKGVPLAVVFGACYSGAALSIGSDHTCVIAASKEDQLAWSNDFRNLSEQFSEVDNLEEAFLRARKDYKLPSQPTINTPAGRETAEVFAALDRMIVATSPMAHERALEPHCKMSADFVLSQSSTPYEQLYKSLAEKIVKAFSPETNLEKMRKSAIALDRAKYKTYAKSHEKVPVDFCTGLSGKICLLTMEDYHKYRKSAEVQLADSTLSEKDRLFWKVMTEDMKTFEKTAKYQKAAIEEKSRLEKIEELDKDMLHFAKEVAVQERTLYNDVYKKKSQELSDKPNPCAAFKLK